MTVMQRLIPCLFAAAALCHAHGLRAQDSLSCGDLENGYGPYDYRDEEIRATKIPIVEKFHLNRDVENLVRGQSGTIMSDLDYTLRAVPNHPRALTAVARYQLAGGSPETYLTADCYFDRALRFVPNDPTVHLMFATYLHRKKDYPAALARYKQAIALAPKSSEGHYNLALLLLDLNQPAQAKQEAIQAYGLGHPMPGLKRKLKNRGIWTTEDEQAVAALLKS